MQGRIVALIDDSGERIDVCKDKRVSLLSPGDRILRGNSIDSFVTNIGKSYRGKIRRLNVADKATWKTSHYVVINIDELDELSKRGVLDNGARGFIMAMLPYLKFESRCA